MFHFKLNCKLWKTASVTNNYEIFQLLQKPFIKKTEAKKTSSFVKNHSESK